MFCMMKNFFVLSCVFSSFYVKIHVFEPLHQINLKNTDEPWTKQQKLYKRLNAPKINPEYNFNQMDPYNKYKIL